MSAENVNIWGKTGCELPNGGLCHACCEYLWFHADVKGEIYVKPPNSPCKYQNSELKDGEGCSLHNIDEKPEFCNAYHCQDEHPDVKLGFIARAYIDGLVNMEYAVDATERISATKEDLEVYAEALQRLQNASG